MKTETLKQIYNEFNLDKDDIFVLKFGTAKKPIITRGGIDKIMKKMRIQIKYDIQKISDDHKYCVIQATGFIFPNNVPEDIVMNGNTPKPKHVMASFGEASPQNNKSPYPIAMAEKRAKSRVVLQMSGLYEKGFFSEDESEDFKKKSQDQI